jgi:hypothetical protein
MASSGFIIFVGGHRPWAARVNDGTSTSAPQTFETLRAAQSSVERTLIKPVRWRPQVDAENVQTAPETWYTQDLPTSAFVVGGAGPFAVADGDQFGVFVDGSGTATVGMIVLGAAEAVAQAAGNYTLAAGSIAATVLTPSGSVATSISVVLPPALPQTAAAAAAWLNANATFSTPGIVTFDSTSTSNTLVLKSVATGSGVEIVVNGGNTLGNSIGFTAATTTAYGTGDFADSSAATAAEVATWISANIAGVSAQVTSQGLTMYRTQPGAAYSLQVDPTSGINFGFDFLVHTGTGS